MTLALEPAILTSNAPASAAGLFSRANAGSRSSGSFAALCAAQLETQPAHEAPPAAPTRVPTAGGNGSQKLPGKPAPKLLFRDSQQNIAPPPSPAILNAVLPEPAAEASASPAATTNAGNAIANRLSQALPAAATPTIPATLSAIEPLANTNPSALALDSAMPPTSGSGKPALGAQPTSVPAPPAQSNPDAANSLTRIASSVLSALRAAEDASAVTVQLSTDQLSTDHFSTDRAGTDQLAASVGSAAAPAAASVPHEQTASLGVPQMNVAQMDAAQINVMRIDVMQKNVAPAAGASDVSLQASAVQASIPSQGASLSQTSANTDKTQPAVDTAEASAAASYMAEANIEPSVSPAPVSPPVLSLEPKAPALPSSSPQTLPPANPSTPAPASPTTVHTLENAAMPRSATELHATPPPSATQPASSSVIALASPLPSGNLPPEKGANWTSKSGNQSFPPSTAQGPAPSAAAAPTVTAISPAENNSHARTADDSAPASASHKTTAVTAAQTVAPLPASPPVAGNALADPAMQATVQAAATGTPTPVAAAASPASAHPPDSGSPAGSGAPLNVPASAELPVHPATGPVRMAQMVNQAAQSEMRIGMNTAAFGNVEVRTVVHANEVGVLIGSEKGDLRSMLANELPCIATTLQQQSLRLNQVNFHQTGFAFSNQTPSGGDPQPRWSASRPMAAMTQPAEAFSAEANEPSATSSAGSGAGLSILA